MPTRILHKRNATPNTPPLASNLSPGELAFNTADGKLYLLRDDNTVVDVSQSIFQRDTRFTVVDDGVSPSTITADIDGTQKLQISAGGVTIDGTVDINSSETLFFNDADNNEYVGVAAPDTVDYSYIFKLPNTLPIDRSVLSILPSGQTTWDQINPFDGLTVYVNEEFGDDTADGEHNPVRTIKRAAQLAAALGKIPLTDPGEEYHNARRLIRDNKDFLIEEAIGYTNATYPVLTYSENLWRRELQKAVEAVQFDIFLSGNLQSVQAGESANTEITSQTEFADVLAHLRDITVNVIKNEVPTTSYQSAVEQVIFPQITGATAETDVVNRYNIIIGIVVNDTSPAIVQPSFRVAPVSIAIANGEFMVDNPVILSEGVTLQSQNARGAILRPMNANVDLFRVRDNSGVVNVTLRDGVDGAGNPAYTFNWAVAFDDPTDEGVDRLGYFGLSSERPVINTPPLVQNLLIVSFLGANGLDVNGARVDRPLFVPTPEPQRFIMQGFAFTVVSFGGIGVLASNDGYAQTTSCVFSFCSEGLYAQSGGYIAASTSGTNFGIYGLRSSGFRADSFNADRGVVANTGTIDGEQFITLVGAERYPLEEYVIKLRNLTTDTDVTSSFKTPTSVSTFDAATDVNPTTDEFTIVGHGYTNGDAVQYSNAGNTSISGLTDGNFYYVQVIDADTFTLYNDEGLSFAVDITDTSTGTHEFLTDVEEFFIQRRQDLHANYQEIVTEAGSFAFRPGDLISGNTGGLTNTAYVASYDDATDTLLVSIEETNGERVFFDATSTITNIDGTTVSIAVNSATTTDQYRTATIIVDSTIPASQMQNLSTAEGLGIRLHRPSIVNATSHVWEYPGTGTDFGALDEVMCCSQGDEFTYREDLPGRVYATGTDQRGDWKVGDVMTVQNRSGRVIFNNLAEANNLSVVELTMTGASINEISTDTGLGDNEPGGAQNSRISTQRAIRSFIAERLNPVLDKSVSSASVPRALVQLNAQGQINQDLLPPGRGISTFPVSGYEERLNLSREIPAISTVTGDQVSETYEQQVLQLTGPVTVAKGSEIIQQNTLATGYAKEDVSSSTTLTLVGPLSGTFNTTDQLEDDGVSLGTDSVPTGVGSIDTITDNYFLSRDTVSQFLKLDPNDTYDFTGITSVTASSNDAEGTITSGPITGVVGATDSNTLVGGTGYTPGTGTETYEFVSLTGGTGTGAIADITVTDGSVTEVDMRRGGSGYAVGNTLSANSADIGGTGTGFSIEVASVQTRLFVDLTGQNVKFTASESTPDYIEDANSPSLSIADFEATTQYVFNAEDVGATGDVNYSTNQITITGHGYANGDTSVYDDNGNGPIGGLVVGTTYWVRVIDANTIELYTNYALNSGAQVLFTSQSTGVHNFTRHVVDLNTSTFYVPGHGASTGTAIRVEASDPPAPIVDGEHFFIGSVTVNTFTLHTNRSDAIASTAGASVNQIALSDKGTGSGTATINDVLVVGVVNTSSRDLENWNIISQQTIDASNVVSGILSTSRLGTDTANDTTFLRGDSTWARAVQNIRTPEPSPLNISGDLFTDNGTDFYYNSLEISVDSVQVGTNPSFTTLGVARFNKAQFTINNGDVSVTSDVINAGTLNGNDGAYYLDPLNLSARVPVSRGGTGLTTYTQGDIIISGSNDSLTQLGIGSPNTVLTSTGTQPTWSASLSLGGTLTVAGLVRLNDVTESTSTTTGAFQVDGGVGIVKNANVGGSLAVTGSATVGGTTTINGATTVNAATNLNGNVVVDNGATTSVTIQSDDAGNSELILLGNLEGTGRVFVGEDASQGGGIEFNGDNNPVTSGAGANYTALYRRTAGTNEWTARNLHTDNDWIFRGQLFSNTSQRVYADDYHPNADAWTTARTLTLTGAVTGNVSIDGSGNVSLATTATSDPTLTLSGDASGTATFTNLGNATLSVSVSQAANANTIANLAPTDFTLDRVTDSGNTTTNAINVGNISTTEVNVQDLTRTSAASVSTSSTTQTVLFTFPVAYGAAKVAINATQGNFRHITELLIAHNGTTASATEYGVVNTDGELFTADVDILSGNVRVLITTSSTTVTEYTASYTLLV